MRYFTVALFVTVSLCALAQDETGPESSCEELYWDKKLALVVTIKELIEFKDVEAELNALQMEYNEAATGPKKESLKQKLDFLKQELTREEEEMDQASSKLEALSLQYVIQCGQPKQNG